MGEKVTGVIDMKEALLSTGLSEWLEGSYQVKVLLDVPEGVETTTLVVTIEVEKKS